MKKTYPVLILLTAFTILFSVYYAKMQLQLNSPESTLLKAFNSSQAEVVSADTYFWGRINDNRYISLKELKVLAEEFSESLGMARSNEFSSKSSGSDFIEEIELNGTMSGNRIVSISVQMTKEEQKERERYISVNVSHDSSNLQLTKTRREVEKVFKKFGIKPKVNSCITGSFEKKLSYDQLNEIGTRVFEGAGARKVEGIREENLVSVSAYSPIISDFISVNGNRVNLNLAIRYNSYENKTYIWLATPVLTIEY